MLHKIVFILTVSIALVSAQDLLTEFGEKILTAASPLPWLDAGQLDYVLSGESFLEDPQEYSSDFGSCNEESENYPVVNHPDFGKARGKIYKSLKGREFYAFHNIPYAMPIDSSRRFMMPEMWEGQWAENGTEFDATYFKAKCPQMSMVVPVPAGREDCLHLSIYIPPAVSEVTTKYPVMFFIHGGAFISGDASLYVPTKLLDRDVVLVAVQYRLGSFGFLASGRADNPGNMGLMDQIMALKWVQQHITYFGGDPNLVTVFGQSAGAASTSWLQLSPLIENDGKPLMHRGILQSGSSLEAWAHDVDPQGSFEVQAREVDCWDETSTDPVTDALKCMRTERTVQQITQGYYNVYVKDRQKGGLGFKGNSPVIQKDFNLNDTALVVIPDNPIKLIKEGKFLKIPLMAGSVRDEGSLVLGLAYTSFLAPNNLTDNGTFLAVEAIPSFINTFGIHDMSGSVADSMELAFLRYTEMGNWDSMSGGLVDMCGMMFLKSGMWTLSHLLTHQNPNDNIFFYSFEYESDDSIFDWYFLSIPDIPIEGGITHANDLLYMFYLPSVMNFNNSKLTTVDRITRLWTDFAKYGNPTPNGAMDNVPNWDPFTVQSGNYMLMTDVFTIQSDFKKRWNHNTLADPSCKATVSAGPQTKQISKESQSEPFFTEMEEEVNGWKVAVGVMMACCVMLVVSTVLLLLKLRTRSSF